EICKSTDDYLRSCRCFTDQRHELRRALGKQPLTLKNVLGNLKCRAALLDYINKTGRFASYLASPS
ncbi:hypothetical protein BV20DRAFT_937884, partial [Pilatotrama ljubarskyi]